MKYIHILIITLLLISCKEQPRQRTIVEVVPEKGLVTENAMVVSARIEASKIGSDIMKKGGNAFDAMIATAMALAVVYPYAGNLGGGGFMVFRTQYGEIGSLDYREKAPLSAKKNMYLDENGEFLEEKSKTGSLAVAVPGTIAGIFEVHEKFGSLPMEELLQPVITLATKGYVITKKQADRLDKYGSFIKEVNGESSLYTRKYSEGDTLRNLALARTLDRISLRRNTVFMKSLILVM